MSDATEKSPQELMLERQLARCAATLESCLDAAETARAKDWCDTRMNELRDAARLMSASARLAGALARLRGATRHTVTVHRGDPHAKKRGSNG